MMVSSRTSVRFMRHCGMILIALPEPVTTVIGVGMVVASRYLSHRIEAGVYKRLRETLRNYMAHFKRFRAGESAAAATQPSTSTTPAKNEARGGSNLAASPGFVLWQRPAHADTMPVYHALDLDRLNRLYGARLKASARQTAALPKIKYHSLNIEAFPRRSPTPPPAPVKVKYHAIDMASLQRRYGLPVAAAAGSRR